MARNGRPSAPPRGRTSGRWPDRPRMMSRGRGSPGSHIARPDQGQGRRIGHCRAMQPNQCSGAHSIARSHRDRSRLRRCECPTHAVEHLGGHEPPFQFEGDVGVSQDHLGRVGLVTSPKPFQEFLNERPEPPRLLLAQRVARFAVTRTRRSSRPSASGPLIAALSSAVRYDSRCRPSACRARSQSTPRSLAILTEGTALEEMMQHQLPIRGVVQLLEDLLNPFVLLLPPQVGADTRSIRDRLESVRAIRGIALPEGV